MMQTASRRSGAWVWWKIGICYLVSVFSLPTCTGFFFSIYLLPGLQYLPLGLIGFAGLILSFILLRQIKESLKSLSEGMRDLIKLNVLLGILAWTFYIMPSFGPLVGKIIQLV